MFQKTGQMGFVIVSNGYNRRAKNTDTPARRRPRCHGTPAKRFQLSKIASGPKTSRSPLGEDAFQHLQPASLGWGWESIQCCHNAVTL